MNQLTASDCLKTECELQHPAVKVDRQFKDVAYYQEDVEKRAERTYHPGN